MSTLVDRPFENYTIAVDFDGVLHSYASGWCGADNCPDRPIEGAIKWLNQMVKDFDVVIFTTRGDQPGANQAIACWLRRYGYNGPDLIVTSKKLPALVYIDDRGWRFEGRFPTTHEVHQAIPWYKTRTSAGKGSRS